MADLDPSRRRLFMHSAHRTIGVSAGLAALKNCDLGNFGAAKATARPLRVCLVSAPPARKEDGSLDVLERRLKEHREAKCTRESCPSVEDWPDLVDLLAYDCVVLLVGRVQFDNGWLTRIERSCRGGRVIISPPPLFLAAGGCAAPDRSELDGEFFSGDYGGQFRAGPTEVVIAAAAKDHPVLAGVEPFVTDGTLAGSLDVSEDAAVLLLGTSAGRTHPVAWTRSDRRGRTLYTSLGHADDFRRPGFLRLLVNAVYWTARRRP